jgi:hypothetical protein
LSQQFESRCLLSATAFVESTAVNLDCSFEEDSASDFDFFLADDFGWLDDSVWMDEEVIFVEPVDSSSIPESFTLNPESIRSAIEEFAVGPVDSIGFGDGVDLQIITLSVDAASGVTVPVDIYVWDGGADTVLTPEFLSQIETALGDALRDVLATGSGVSITSLDATPFSGSSADFASTYGIQPIEVYVDIDRDTTTDSNQLYVSGVTVVSEDPFDSEFVIVDEFVFFADEFVTSTGEIVPEVTSTADTAVPAPEVVNADLIADNSNSTLNELPESPATDGEEAATGDDLLEREGVSGSDADPSASGLVSLRERRSEKLSEDQTTDKEAPARTETISGAARRQAYRENSAGSAEQAQVSPTATASSGDSREAMTWQQRFRSRAITAARQIAEAAGRDPRSLHSLAISAATDSFAPDWNSTLAAFTQTLLSDQLIGLIDSSLIDDSPADENIQPTYAQIASGTGTLLTAAAATTHAIRRRRSVEQKRLRIADSGTAPWIPRRRPSSV